MSARPLLYDGFCGAGGATRGYQEAGFRVVGIDNRPQPRYCGDGFVQMDFLEFAAAVQRGEFQRPAAWHTSPPCQGYSISRNNGQVHARPRLIPETRALLVAAGVPYVIENVEGARSEMRWPTLLCGGAFGLGVLGRDMHRHRLFEVNWLLMAPPCAHRRGHTVGVYGNGTNSWHRRKFGHNLTVTHLREAMGVDWMTRDELGEAIPPAYTRFIGEQLLRALGAEREAA